MSRAKWLKLLFLLLGVGLLIWSIQAVDLHRVGQMLWDMGPGFLAVLAVYSVVTWLDTISWKFGFDPASARALPLFDLWRIRQIGESFNTITPFGTVGGEPVKAQLLKDHHRLTFKQGLASQVVARTTFLTALIVFMIPGVILLMASGSATGPFKTISVTLLIGFSTAILLFFLFQVSGSLGRINAWLKRRIPALVDSPTLAHLDELDQLMSGYYRQHAPRFVKSIAWAFAGWVVGLGELYVTLFFLGTEVSFTDLWIIEAVSQLIRVCSFFVPLSLGVQEGGLVLIFVSMGYTADLGLAVSLVRRIKELLWVGLGLALGGGLALRPSQIEVNKAEP